MQLTTKTTLFVLLHLISATPLIRRDYPSPASSSPVAVATSPAASSATTPAASSATTPAASSAAPPAASGTSVAPDAPVTTGTAGPPAVIIYKPTIPDPACDVAEKPHVVSFFADDSFHGGNWTINFPTNCCVHLNDVSGAKDMVSSFDTRDSYCTLYSTVDCEEEGTRNGWPTGWMQLSGRRDGHVIKDGKIQYKSDGKPEMKPWNDKISSVKCEVGDP